MTDVKGLSLGVASCLSAFLLVSNVEVRTYSSDAQFEQRQTFRERVDVPRVLVDVRAVDNTGRAIRGLGVGDFAVTIDGTRAVVDSVEWVPEASPDVGSAAAPAATGAIAAGNARWLVFVVQRKAERAEMVGLMRLAQDAASFAEWFAQGGRVAIVSFDSQLHTWTNFSNDVAELRRVLTNTVISGRPPTNVRIDAESGAIHVQMRSPDERAPESLPAALQQIGEMLEPLPGTKSIVVLGRAMGEWIPRLGRVELGHDYEVAVTALRRSRVSVFCFDYTNADYHPLQEGLMQVAADTGGRFWQTDRFAAAPLGELRQLLEGHYVLLVVPPDERTGERALAVKVNNRRATVLVKSGYVAERP